jgi:SAM-dependent methyltransferase/BMFP domain-containing protein YqiC
MIKYIMLRLSKCVRKAREIMDQNLINIISENLDDNFIDIVISQGTKGFELTKVKVRPVLLKGGRYFQASETKGKQIFHNNYTKDELLLKINEWFDVLKQMLLRTRDKQITVLISKKGKATIKQKRMDNENLINSQQTLNHNREKSYILSEGQPISFLIDLGVMNDEGKIIKAKYDKFKQINRFLEFIEDIIPSLDKTRELTIIDFGCGKSYLTFAMYYYLKELKGYQIRVIGLDLKKDVIKNCNELSVRYGFDKLTFLEGDIASFEGVDKVDMVVTLHACDTATDYALYKAIKWDADVILSVPCCQHELNNQIHSDVLNPILQYGLIKERFAALTTDAIRAELLEAIGYKAQILEFIDMEHTPKNILIRAVKRVQKKDNNVIESNKNAKKVLEPSKMKSIEELRKFLGIEPTLYQLLMKDYNDLIKREVN